MAKKRGNDPKLHGQTPLRGHAPITLRQEAAGLKPTSHKDAGVTRDPKAMLRLEHLQRVASWASGVGSAPSLAAFFGRRLAATREALAILPDPSLVTCQRCETILQPGYNCTVRVEKSRAKKRRRSKKRRTPSQNSVVYSCQFCSYRSSKRGTPKGHMKELHPTKARPISKKNSVKAVPPTSSSPEFDTVCGDESGKLSAPDFSASEAVLQTSRIPEFETARIDEICEITEGFMASEVGPPSDDKMSTPVTKPSPGLLVESRRKKRNRSSAKKPVEPEGGQASAEASVGTSKKRRRKSWTTLKEIAERSESGIGKSISDLKIPFLI